MHHQPASQSKTYKVICSTAGHSCKAQGHGIACGGPVCQVCCNLTQQQHSVMLPGRLLQLLSQPPQLIAQSLQHAPRLLPFRALLKVDSITAAAAAAINADLAQLEQALADEGVHSRMPQRQLLLMQRGTQLGELAQREGAQAAQESKKTCLRG
eukprot:1161380-Pelagomonas_calceolata.AAC.8